jgi:hypothetical protein
MLSFTLRGSSGCVSGKLTPPHFWVFRQINVSESLTLGEVRKNEYIRMWVSVFRLSAVCVSTEQLWLSWFSCIMLKLLKCSTAHRSQYLQGKNKAGVSDECTGCALVVRVGLYSMVLSSGKQFCSNLGLEESVLRPALLCICGWSCEHVPWKPFGHLNILWYCDKIISGEMEVWNFVVVIGCLELS